MKRVAASSRKKEVTGGGNHPRLERSPVPKGDRGQPVPAARPRGRDRNQAAPKADKGSKQAPAEQQAANQVQVMGRKQVRVKRRDRACKGSKGSPLAMDPVRAGRKGQQVGVD